MLRPLLKTITFILCIVTTNTSASDLTAKYKNSQTYGIFKLSIDDYDTFMITPTKRLYIDKHFKQIGNLHGHYYQDYFKLKNTQQKALFAYQFLLKVSKKADFRVDIRSGPKRKERMTIVLISDRETRFGHGITLIPNKDMKTVFPILLKLIETQAPIHFNLDYDHKDRRTVKSKRHETATYTPQQAWQIADNYHYGYNLLTAEHKALLTYGFLLQLATNTDFNISFSDKYQINNALELRIPAHGLEEGVKFELMPTDDIDSVYPLLLEFMQDRPSTHYEDPQIVAKRIAQDEH